MENAPLLSDEPHQSPPKPRSSFEMYKNFRTLGVMCVLIFLIETCVILQTAPQTQILEDAICDKYYVGKDSLQPTARLNKCKAGDVQRELAFIKGWQYSLDQVPGFVMALPYAALSTKWGHRSILSLSLFGYLVSTLWIQFVCWRADIFPLRLTWLSSLAQFAGGGGMVFYAIIFSLASDIATEGQRTNLFIILSSLTYLAEIFITPISIALMHWNPWISLIASDVIVVILIGLAFALPVSQKIYKLIDSIDSEQDSGHDSDESLPIVKPPSFTTYLKRCVKAVQLIIKNRMVAAIFLTLLMAACQRATNDLILIYASDKFNLTIADASFLAQLRGAMSLLLSLIILPTISHMIERSSSLDPQERDLLLSRFSTLLIAIGFMVFGVASKLALATFGVVITALGSGINGLCKSIIVSLFDTNTTATILSAVAMQQTIGAMIAGPLFSYLYGVGLGLGTAWIGIPFVVLGALFLLCCLFLFSSRIEY
jgi:MFS family permease